MNPTTPVTYSGKTPHACWLPNPSPLFVKGAKDLFAKRRLKKVIEAMGGELVIIARFPNVEVCINHVALENNDTIQKFN